MGNVCDRVDLLSISQIYNIYTDCAETPALSITVQLFVDLDVH